MREEIIGDARLILGDCRDVLPGLGKVDAVVTDPPYGLGIANNPVRQRHARSDWDDSPVDGSILSQLIAMSREQIIWGGNYFELPPAQCFLVWDKKQPEDFSLAMCEMAWCSKKKPAKIWRQSVLSYEKHHPTQKPVQLMQWCLGFVSGDVLDPFMGSGTTGVAAIGLGRRFIGIEIDATHFETACRRIDAAVRAPRLDIPEPRPRVEQPDIFETVRLLPHHEEPAGDETVKPLAGHHGHYSRLAVRTP